eukprot:TRINITY_DN113002_c0_g1_i1.p1 TRINITY_DN113002_c0_g1~~TRINITY_DN113002_c0_g1_i1.p1  ORF type:complete len:548 (+),score=64.51 TRINITY_DN113002_c0_g1_i1:35-1678(+)
MPSVKRVAVIGAGLCGLASIKHLTDAGLDVVCFEGEEALGGLWKYSDEERHSSVYRSTHINTGRDVNQFSDLPMPLEWDVLLHHSFILRYLNMYAEKFGLLQHIRFNTRVSNITPTKEFSPGMWNWEITSTTQGKPQVTEQFDAVFMCSGHHSKPRIPSFPGSSSFSGQQMHSHGYKEPSPFKDKTVVIVGIGNSGSDLTAEVSKHAKQTYLVSRSGTWIVSNPQNFPQITCPSRFDSNLTGMLPLSWQSKVWENHPAIATNTKTVLSSGLKPEHGVTSAHPTITLNTPQNNLIQQLNDGRILVKKNIKEMKGNSVSFTDGSTIPDVEHIIYCTGYHIKYPFLDKKVLEVDDDNNAPLYKNMWLTSEYQNIVFIGLVQPVGSMFMISDIQSLVATDWLLGKWNLPTRQAMKESVAARQQWLKKQYKASPRHTIQVHVREYLDELGNMNGITPTFWRLLTQRPGALITAYKCPTYANSYRLVGPHKLKEAPTNMAKEYKKLYSKAENRVLGWGLLRYLIAANILAVVGFFYEIFYFLTHFSFHFQPFV